MFKIIKTFSLEDSKTFPFCDKSRLSKRIKMQNFGYFHNFMDREGKSLDYLGLTSTIWHYLDN